MLRDAIAEAQCALKVIDLDPRLKNYNSPISNADASIATAGQGDQSAKMSLSLEEFERLVTNSGTQSEEVVVYKNVETDITTCVGLLSKSACPREPSERGERGGRGGTSEMDISLRVNIEEEEKGDGGMDSDDIDIEESVSREVLACVEHLTHEVESRFEAST